MFAVMAETHDGKTHILRKGFATQEDAKDHPIIMKHWRRVWVDKDPTPPVVPVDGSAPEPWDVEWVNGRAYILDGLGRRIASLLGPQARRETVAALVIERTKGNQQ